MAAAKPTDPVPQQPPPTGMVYPGGENTPGYRLAFQAWMLLALLTICIGLLNFLGSYLKMVWQ
jgi:hypothetical protein